MDSEKSEKQLWYLSFGSYDFISVFLGACVVEADGKMEACARACALGLTPKGECEALVVQVPRDIPPDEPQWDVYYANRDRLLTDKETRELFHGKTKKEWDDEDSPVN